VVHQIVTQHGGTVKANRNEQGPGMTFSLFFPQTGKEQS
jgi:signal transduction histidine kinase